MAEAYVEICLRCGAAMEWRHGTFQCPRCRLKLGCCEGETGECRPEPYDLLRTSAVGEGEASLAPTGTTTRSA